MKTSLGFWRLACLALLAAGCVAGPMPRKGDKAPSFTATLHSGEKATLEKLMGEKGLVLYFYPKDETPGCTTQACTFQKKLVDFQNKGFRVVGVSVDDGASHQKFRSKYNLTFDLVSDTDQTIAGLYNVPIATDPAGTTGLKRTTFVISKDGVIQRRFEDPDVNKQVEDAYESLSQPF